MNQAEYSLPSSKDGPLNKSNNALGNKVIELTARSGVSPAKPDNQYQGLD